MTSSLRDTRRRGVEPGRTLDRQRRPQARASLQRITRADLRRADAIPIRCRLLARRNAARTRRLESRLGHRVATAPITQDGPAPPQGAHSEHIGRTKSVSTTMPGRLLALSDDGVQTRPRRRPGANVLRTGLGPCGLSRGERKTHCELDGSGGRTQIGCGFSTSFGLPQWFERQRRSASAPALSTGCPWETTTRSIGSSSNGMSSERNSSRLTCTQVRRPE